MNDWLLHNPGDLRSTSMPQSRWKNLVAAGIKQHCAVRGMSQEEVLAALGKPTEITPKFVAQGINGPMSVGEVWN